MKKIIAIFALVIIASFVSAQVSPDKCEPKKPLVSCETKVIKEWVDSLGWRLDIETTVHVNNNYGSNPGNKLEWGDGFSESNLADGAKKPHTYRGQGKWTIVWSAWNNMGTSSSNCGIFERWDNIPWVKCKLEPESGNVPTEATMTFTGVGDSDGFISRWEIVWGDGTSDSGNGTPPPSKSHTFTKKGESQVVTTVWDNEDMPSLPATCGKFTGKEIDCTFLPEKKISDPKTGKIHIYKYLEIKHRLKPVKMNGTIVGYLADLWGFPIKKSENVTIEVYTVTQKIDENRTRDDKPVLTDTFPYFVMQRWPIVNIKGNKFLEMIDGRLAIHLIYDRPLPNNSLITFLIKVRCQDCGLDIIVNVSTLKDLVKVTYFFPQSAVLD